MKRRRHPPGTRVLLDRWLPEAVARVRAAVGSDGHDAILERLEDRFLCYLRVNGWLPPTAVRRLTDLTILDLTSPVQDDHVYYYSTRPDDVARRAKLSEPPPSWDDAVRLLEDGA